MMCVCECVCLCVFVCVKVPCMHDQLPQQCLTLCHPMDNSLPGSSVHGILPGKKTGVGCHALLPGIFLTQGSNLSLLCLLHWQANSLPLSHWRSPKYPTIIALLSVSPFISVTICFIYLNAPVLGEYRSRNYRNQEWKDWCLQLLKMLLTLLALISSFL